MSQVLYRKYRPRTFSEIKGQEHVVQTLKGAIELDRVAHAYLFCGPRGTGKTTIARIFAKTLNCQKRKNHEPCNACHICEAINENRSLDIIEIDGASNRGIDEIRNIKEISRVAALQNNYKIFIIDEVHSLTKDAFNALLKTLEEPPPHVKFILATTEPHKLLPTVLSRVQRFDFKKLPNSQIIEKLKEIAKSEKIKAEEEVLRLIAINSEGSLRDAESNFAKLISLEGETVTLNAVKQALGFIPFEIHADFISAIIKKEKNKGIQLISELYESGADLDNFTGGLLNFLRKIIVAKASPKDDKLFSEELTPEQISYIKKLSENLDTKLIINLIQILTQAKQNLKTTPIPQLPLELVVMEFVG